MAKRGRKPLVTDEQITEAIFKSADRALTAVQAGVYTARMNRLVDAGVLTRRKATRKVVDAEGTPQRGRPSVLFGLSKRSADRLRRQARKAQTA